MQAEQTIRNKISCEFRLTFNRRIVHQMEENPGETLRTPKFGILAAINRLRQKTRLGCFKKPQKIDDLSQLSPLDSRSHPLGCRRPSLADAVTRKEVPPARKSANT